ncbi:DUF3617 domain-containing protein [uncultured Erythrobacter sp.]|uniref:DUF3617 domain-containing protein n=1 Tax=uncultured Erythrobacter sp. TaxID=263913 RepID=UPI002611D9F5|nr:DUF3617 domain-containing protein [uncultured Erythrobacter sp.]
MKPLAAIAALSVALAGCGGSDVTTAEADADGDGAVSVNEAAQIAADSGLKPEPGKYKVVSEMGGMKTNVEYCLTPEQAEGGFENMMQEGQQGDCSYEKFELAGNDLDAVLTCDMDGGQMRMEMAGTVGSTSSDLEMKISGAMGGINVDMTSKMKQERIGDCDE